jgi:acyl carrier protein
VTAIPADSNLETIRTIVKTRMQRRREFSDNTALVSGGLIDSMAIVDLILDLESAFRVTIPASDVQPDDFDTVNRIAATVARFR